MIDESIRGIGFDSAVGKFHTVLGTPAGGLFLAVNTADGSVAAQRYRREESPTVGGAGHVNPIVSDTAMERRREDLHRGRFLKIFSVTRLKGLDNIAQVLPNSPIGVELRVDRYHNMGVDFLFGDQLVKPITKVLDPFNHFAR